MNIHGTLPSNDIFVTGNQGNIKERLKNVFISQKNSGYLFDMIIKKIIKTYPQYNNILIEYIETYKMNMINLQELIFDDNFILIYENKKELEDVLIALNKITVGKFEYLLLQDLNKKHVEVESEKYQDRNNSIKEITENEIDKTENDIELKERYDKRIHFMSDDSYKNNKGQYMYNIHVPKLKSIDLQSIYLKCNMYNINELNNKFYIIEQNVKTLITIPIGYYSIHNLLDCMTKFLNLSSINKNKDYTFKLFVNMLKNRVYFTTNNNNTNNNNNNTFSLLFIENDYNYNLQKICGFNRISYANNSIYMAENSPDTNIFEKIYVQIFLNDIPLNKYETTKKNFCYYDILHLDMEKDFGKTLTFSSENNQYDIDIDEDFDLKTIGFQFNNNYNYSLDNLKFEIIIRFEYI